LTICGRRRRQKRGRRHDRGQGEQQPDAPAAGSLADLLKVEHGRTVGPRSNPTVTVGQWLANGGYSGRVASPTAFLVSSRAGVAALPQRFSALKDA
jgi:hypothetical protein